MSELLEPVFEFVGEFLLEAVVGLLAKAAHAVRDVFSYL